MVTLLSMEAYMNWIIITSSLSLLLITLWVSGVKLWLKHLKVRHVVKLFGDVHRYMLALEEILISPSESREQLKNMEDVWKQIRAVFNYHLVKYIPFVWNTQSKNLYVACRYGEDLKQMLLLPLISFEKNPQYKYQVYEYSIEFLKYAKEGLRISTK